MEQAFILRSTPAVIFLVLILLPRYLLFVCAVFPSGFVCLVYASCVFPCRWAPAPSQLMGVFFVFLQQG